MEFGSIERELHIDASPEIVFEVVSRPEHLREWWPDEADLEPVPGGTGAPSRYGADHVESLTVVDADPPRRFSFRWVYDDGRPATPENSLLVTFDLVPAGTGTLLRFTETGFRERGWEAAVLEEQYPEHVAGWDHFLPRLVAYAARGRSGMSLAVDDELWSAIGDPTRRRMLDLLLAGGGTATTPERPPAGDPPGSGQAPRGARPGRARPRDAYGRERRYEVDQAQLARAVAQLSAVGAAWDARLDRIKRIAERIQRGQRD